MSLGQRADSRLHPLAESLPDEPLVCIPRSVFVLIL